MKPFILTLTFCLTFAGVAMAAQANMSHSEQPHKRAYNAPGHVPIGESDPGAQIDRTIEVTVTETDTGKMLFVPDAIHIKQGSTVRFVIKNDGALDHEFFLGAFDEIGEHQQWMREYPDMEHDEPNSVTIPNGTAATLNWKFSRMTNLEFVCLIPDHREAGMWGVIMVHDHLAPKSTD